MKLVLKLHDHITVSQTEKIIDEMRAYGEVAIEPEVVSGDQAAPKTEPEGKLKTVLTFDELYQRWASRKYREAKCL